MGGELATMVGPDGDLSPSFSSLDDNTSGEEAPLVSSALASTPLSPPPLPASTPLRSSSRVGVSSSVVVPNADAAVAYSKSSLEETTPVGMTPAGKTTPGEAAPLGGGVIALDSSVDDAAVTAGRSHADVAVVGVVVVGELLATVGNLR